GRSADFQSAVSPNCIRQGVGRSLASAFPNASQSATLRYHTALHIRMPRFTIRHRSAMPRSSILSCAQAALGWLRVRTSRQIGPPSTASNAGAPHRPVFVTTHWSVVLAAGRDDTASASEALAKLCQTYWYPLYAYVRQRG